VRYSLAVNKFRKGEDSITDWYNITIFDEGELQKAEKALRVGNKMIVDVTLRLDKFEDPETKKVQTRTSLIQKHAEIVQWGKRTDEDRA
ncbi:single-stranded DNA-binding protein, partial [Mycobacterium tuberculosis]|nr:single-stranded DNA-binding protein [Mycobacterium tuberculosis]